MKFAFVAKHQHVWPVIWICAALQESRLGFHAWLNRPASVRPVYDKKLSEIMRQSLFKPATGPTVAGASRRTCFRKGCPAACIGSIA